MSLVRSVIAALVALASVVLLPVGAAQAYPEGTCNVSLSASTLEGGKSFRATATSDGPTTLSITFLGETRSKSDVTSFSTVFQTPRVSEPTQLRVTVSCGDEVGGTDLTLLPPGGDNVGGDNGGGSNGGGNGVGSNDDNAGAGADQADTNGILPNTGGAYLWILILAIILVAGGTYAVVRRRRA